MKVGNLYLILLIVALFAIGCSQSGNDSIQSSVTPSMQNNGAQSLSGTQVTGIYQITLDPLTETAEIIPMRTAEVEVNVLKFLEPPGSPANIVMKDLAFAPPLVEGTVAIQHPFAGYPEYMGFCVRGIVLTNGSMATFENTSLKVSSPDQVRLTNADGLTRWMNPQEFPFDGTIFNYHPGLKGDPAGNLYDCTLNPYKFFADGLTAANESMDLDESLGAVFSPGALNERRYKLDFGSQAYLVFQYAVVASTEIPLTSPPQDITDFPVGTLPSEPWRVDVTELTNTLWYDGGQDGGDLSLRVVLYDFENIDQDIVYVEAPEGFPKQEMTLVDSQPNALTYESDIPSINLDTANPLDILVSAIAQDAPGWDGRLPGEELGTYVLHVANVLDEEPQTPDWPFYDDFETTNFIWTAHGGDWWGKANGYMDAAGGGNCFEENDGDDSENLNVSYVSSPPIDVPASPDDLLMTINHTLEVDPVEVFGSWAWDMCYVRIDGTQVFPTSGTLYEDNYYPMSFDPIKCWTNTYPMVESVFNLGTDYNGTTIQVEFVLDTYDNINNCDPPFFGWWIDDVLLEHTS